MNQRSLFFSSGTLKLEGRLAIPARAEKVAGVVLCHPHPLYGGSMDNNVLFALSAALIGRGIASLCFNFRGVGQSEGEYDGAQGEIDDALAAAAFLADLTVIDPAGMGLAGYSFGGAIALEAGLLSDTIKAVVAVSPHQIPALDGAAWPWLLLCGSADNLISVSAVLEQKEKIVGADGAGAVEVIDGADHFWYGHEQIAADRAASFFQQHLAAARR